MTTNDIKCITIAICNYNTSALVNACLASLRKNIRSFRWKAVILDNSDKEKLCLDSANAQCTTVLDNTRGQLIDFSHIVQQFGKSFDETHGSFKHCYSIQFLLNICQTSHMLLLDSDVIAKKDFDFINSSLSYVSTFDVGQRKTYKPRSLPYIQLFNMQLVKKYGLKYFDPYRIRGGLSLKNSAPYDTGASFYEDAMNKKVPIHMIDFTDYVFHLRSASFSNNRNQQSFLDQYAQFFCDNAQIDAMLDYKVVVSLTSWKNRIQDGSLMTTLQSLVKQKFNGKFRIALTLTKDDLAYVSGQTKAFLHEHRVEVLIADEDLKPHKKYFYAMMKWRQLPIITVDDDLVYDDDLVQSLYNSYKEFPECISARRTHRMQYSLTGQLLPYRKWTYEDSSLYATPSDDLFATGGGGVIYPENCLQLSNADLPMIKQCMNADDVFLKRKEQLLKIKVVHVKGQRAIPYSQQKSSTAPYALCFKNNTPTRCDNDMYIKIVGLA